VQSGWVCMFSFVVDHSGGREIDSHRDAGRQRNPARRWLGCMLLTCASLAAGQESGQDTSFFWTATGRIVPDGSELVSYEWEGKTEIGNFSFSHLSMLPIQGTAFSDDGVFYKLWFVSVGKQDNQSWEFGRLESSDNVARAELTDAPFVGDALGVVFDSVSTEYRQGECRIHGCRRLSLSSETKKLKWHSWEFSAESNFDRHGRDNGALIHAKFYIR
jgi:hypothetical protein